jgi:hypothetical protein
VLETFDDGTQRQSQKCLYQVTLLRVTTQKTEESFINSGGNLRSRRIPLLAALRMSDESISVLSRTSTYFCLQFLSFYLVLAYSTCRIISAQFTSTVELQAY